MKKLRQARTSRGEIGTRKRDKEEKVTGCGEGEVKEDKTVAPNKNNNNIIHGQCRSVFQYFLLLLKHVRQK